MSLFKNLISAFLTKKQTQNINNDDFLKSYPTDESNQSVIEQEFDDTLIKIHNNRLQLTNEEEELLKKMADRF